MLHIIYDILLWLLAPLFLTYHWWRSVGRKRPAAMAERLGFLPADVRKSVVGKAAIWVHAVSVGETLAVRPLLKALKARYPERILLLSSGTETGRRVAQSLQEADICIYFPFDFSFACRRLLEAIRPELVVVVETEIWPNFLRQAIRRNIPCIMVNGRISDRSFVGYLRFSWVFRQVLQYFSLFCMQTDEDARRIKAIGATASKVMVTGSLKYDQPVAAVSRKEKYELKNACRIPEKLAVFTAGSTHNGEDEQVITAFQALLASGKESLLVLVPRHPERATAVAALLERAGIRTTLRSKLDIRSSPFVSGEALLVDTIGELMRFYGMAEVVFVGGSLVPTGGHNLLEPASRGVPMLYGPHMNNFREIAAMVSDYGAGVEVGSADEFTSILIKLWGDEARRQTMGANGIRLVRENGGATARHMDVLAGFLEPR